jgi:hypothetical protein
MSKRVPIVWSYLFDEVIGSAVFEDDGSVTMRFTDSRLRELIEQEQKDNVKAFSISHRPAVPTDGTVKFPNPSKCPRDPEGMHYYQGNGMCMYCGASDHI